jgi:hypothetical protein
MVEDFMDVAPFWWCNLHSGRCRWSLSLVAVARCRALIRSWCGRIHPSRAQGRQPGSRPLKKARLLPIVHTAGLADDHQQSLPQEALMDGISGSTNSLIELGMAMSEIRLQSELSVSVLRKGLDAHAQNAINLIALTQAQSQKVNTPETGQLLDLIA